MKTIKRELAHVGMFGQDGTKVTKQDLAEVAETFDGKGPITLGHELADWMPKFGNTVSVELYDNGTRLRGELEIHDVLADAVDEKFYEDISVGLPRRKSDNKRYLHHVAYLGAIPPKIRDLKIFSDLGVMFCGDDGDIPMFADTAPVLDPAPAKNSTEEISAALQRIADKGRAAWPFEEVTKALAILTTAASEMLLAGAAIPDSLKEQMAAFADQLATKPGAAGKEEDVELKEENEQLKKELADSQAAVVATAKEGLKKAMVGRIPAGKQGLVLELADRLGGTESIELADEADPTKKEKVSGLEVLRRVLESISKPVAEGRVDLGDAEQAADKKPVAVPFDKA